MSSRGTLQHKKAIIDYLDELTKQGYRTINLNGFSPDGIAVKDNQIIAVEVLLHGPCSKASTTSRMKREQYFMFDNVFVKKIKRDKEKDNECKLKDGGTHW